MKRKKNIQRLASISITIPAYNEEETVRDVIIDALECTKKNFQKFEILLVDDGSTDRTGEIMDFFQRENKNNIRVIHHKKNQGFSGAMKTCYMNASGEMIFLGPADGQFEYNQVKSFVNELVTNNYDIVVGYRVVNVENVFRKFNSFCFRLISRLLFGIKLKEFTRCILYTKKVRDSIYISAEPTSCLFLPELVYKAIQKKYSFGQVPMHFGKRKGGKAKGSETRLIIKTLIAMIGFWWDIKTRKIHE